MIRVGIVGFGKIAVDQHVPAMKAVGGFELAAAVNRNPLTLEGVPTFTDHREMLKAVKVDAVAVCTPPSVRYVIARDCLEAGKHVLLEKPPGVTLGEVEALARLAEQRGLSLMTTWHAQANDAVAAAAEAIGEQRIAAMNIVWHEDVRKWHPGQRWIWEPGGFGVFDPGINALSIATRIVPAGLIVARAKLFVPANKAMPIAAELGLTSPQVEGEIPVDFDWRASGDERWTIDLRLASGSTVGLSDGGARLVIDGQEPISKGGGEYAALYAEFAGLIADVRSHVDIEPLRIVADAFLMGDRVEVEAFEG